MTTRVSDPNPAVDDQQGLGLVAGRAFIDTAPLAWFDLLPGDRPLVGQGDTVLPGAPLAELLHDRRVAEVGAATAGEARSPGGRWSGRAGARRMGQHRGSDAVGGELLFEIGGRWRIATGDPGMVLESPAAGIVREVRPGVGISLQVAGAGLRGVQAIGAPARGRLEIASAEEGDVRAAGLTVGRAGTILIVGGRVDAETLTRARAMGIRGIVVGSLTAKGLRDFAASEARQRASLHRLLPFAVLVLDGAVRRRVASPVRAALAALAGRDVAIVGDPPLLLFDPGGVAVPRPAAGWVRVRQGAWGGREGRWVGLAGVRRFRGGVRQEAGLVQFDEGAPVALPLGDIERFL